MASLDLDSLRAFIAVADTSSFSRAGEKVGRSQSAVSLQLARLEKILGKVLVIRRQGRVLGLSEDGRELLRYARQIIALNDAAYRAVAQARMPSRIRLGIPHGFMTENFVTLLHQFRRAHDLINIEVISDVSRRLIEQVQVGFLDLAFFRQIPGHGYGTFILQESLVWAGPQEWLPPSSDSPLPLVLFPDGCAIRESILDALEKQGLFWRISYTGSSLDGILLAIRHGIGFTALPRNLLVGDDPVLNDGVLPAVGDVEIAVQLGKNSSSAIRVLADMICTHIKERATPPARE